MRLHRKNLVMDPRSLPLFPVPIGLYNFGEDNHELNVGLIQDILNENKRDPKGQVRSNMGGWHSKSRLENEYKTTRELCGIIETWANHYCEQHGYVGGLRCEQIWANINETGDINLPHAHGNAALTGVYYPVESVSDDDHCYFNYDPRAIIKPGTWDGEHGGSLVFYDPSYGKKNTLVKDTNNPSPFTFDSYYTYPVSGLLILFPSYIIHTVTPFKENKRRVSISFVCNYGKT